MFQTTLIATTKLNLDIANRFPFEICIRKLGEHFLRAQLPFQLSYTCVYLRRKTHGVAPPQWYTNHA